MKITDFAVLFLVISITVFVMLDIHNSEISDNAEKKVEYDMKLDSAVDDATKYLVEVDSNRKLTLNKEMAVNKYFRSLYSNFGVLSNKKSQDLLKMYTPVIVVIDYDGYYILYNRMYKKDGSTYVSQRWTEKKVYSYEDSNYIYSFSLNEYVKIYSKYNHTLEEGKVNDIAVLYPDSVISKRNFDEIRRNTIINTITEDVNYYINKHNQIAGHFGITYNFSIPNIEKEEWNRTIDDISFLVFFQGYPYGTYSLDTYNRFSIAAARVKKSNCYYIQDNYYHKDDCTLLRDRVNAYYSKKEVALEGSYPCQKCKP